MEVGDGWEDGGCRRGGMKVASGGMKDCGRGGMKVTVGG